MLCEHVFNVAFSSLSCSTRCTTSGNRYSLPGCCYLIALIFPMITSQHRCWLDDTIGVRDGGQGGSCPPQFGQFVDIHSDRVDIIRAKHNTCLNNTNLGSVTAVNGTNSATTPPPNRARKISATTPPPPNPFGQNRSAPPNGCWPVHLWMTPIDSVAG